MFTCLNMFWSCSQKSNLPSRWKTKCFWNCTYLAKLLLKFSWECDVFFILWRKTTSCTCLLGSGLKVIFHRFARKFILLNLPFKLFADKLILSTTEKSKKSLAKSLAFVEVSWKIIYINQNNNETRAGPCGTHDSISDHEGSWIFNTNFMFQEICDST